ncbi:MAG: hypothetical protein ACI8PD_002281 [Nitrospinales bacterium]|jgi:hypothetical protein
MNQRGLPFSTDYFDFLNLEPEELEDIVMWEGIRWHNINGTESVDDLLPYGERKILEETKNTNILLTELHIKIDTLLSAKNKKILNKELEHTSPLQRVPQKTDYVRYLTK